MIERHQIDALLKRLPEVEARLSDPGVAANQKRFRELVREHSRLKRLAAKAERYLALLDDAREHRELIEADDADPELVELAGAELPDIEEALPDAERELLLVLMPPDPSDERNAIVEIRAGTGGDEAALFAGDLFRLYNRFAESKGWSIGIVDLSTSEVGGYKEVVFTVGGEGAYGTLKFESGGHRVQRVPVTESQGRIHTSAATVAVFPEAEPDDDIHIAPDEIRVDIFRSSGPGGQSVNTTDSAVRITHLPTGLVVQCQDEKSQHRNKDKALSVLKSRLLDLKRQEEADRKGEARRSLIGTGDRSQRVRTYNFPQNRLTDHRIGLTLYSLDRIMEGDIDDLIAALAAHDTQLRVADGLSRVARHDAGE